MDVRMLKRLFQAATVGTSMLSCLTSFAGDHRMFPDEPQRPHISAASQPNWGFNQTCWQRFPDLPPCDGQAGCMNGQCGTNSMYVPQNMQPQMIHPQVMPHSYPMAPANMSPPVSQMPSMMAPPMDSGTQWSSPPAMQQFPSPVPAMPDQNMRYSEPQPSTIPMMQAPGSVPALPPLPEPSPGMNVPQSQVPAIPNQTSAGPRPRDYRTVRPVQITPASRITTPRNASRYGQPSASVSPVMSPPPAGYSNTARLVASSKAGQTPVAPTRPVQPETNQPSTNAPMNNRPYAPQNAQAARYTSGSSTAPIGPATSTRYSATRKPQPGASSVPVRTASQSRPVPTQPLPESSRYSQKR